MKIKRKREFYVERERRVTIRFGNTATEQFCAVCNGESRFVTIDEAAIICGTNRLSIFRLIESLKLHSAETPAGRLLVCLASLTTFKNHQPPSANAGGSEGTNF